MQVQSVHLIDNLGMSPPLKGRSVLKVGQGGIAALTFHPESFGPVVFVVYDDDTRKQLGEDHTGVDMIPLSYCKKLDSIDTGADE